MTTQRPTSLPAVGTACTRAEMLAAAGSRTRRAAVLRAAGGGPVVGLALTSTRNPRAPTAMVVGPGDRPAREARELIESAGPLPVWVRTAATGPWVYAGLFTPTRFDTTARGRAAAGDATPGAVGVVRFRAADVS